MKNATVAGETCRWTDWTPGAPTCTTPATLTVYRSDSVQEIAEDFCADHATNMVAWYPGAVMEPVEAGA